MTLLDTTTAMPARSGPRTLSVAYTPDSDDVFNFYAWEHGQVTLPDHDACFTRDHISVLNEAARDGLHDVVAVSSVAYPHLADRYWILSAGSSVGRGYGPVLVAPRGTSADDLAGRRVGIAGHRTTGGALAHMYCPDATFVETPYDAIAGEILRGTLDAGVMIHEELVHFPQLGLHRVLDLGGAWTDDTGLPLPVGLNLVKQSVGRATAREIVAACRASLRWGLEHPAEAMTFADGFGRGCASTFVPMFSNDDTLRLPDDVLRAMDLLFERLADMGMAPRLDHYEVIDA